MQILVLFYSRTGNNRLLAQTLATRLGAEIEEVRPTGWRTIISLLLDMARDRRPHIRPLVHDVGNFDRLLLLAPLWDMQIAHPMKTLLEGLKGAIPAYSFVSFCGYARDGQEDAVRAQLLSLTGREPEHVAEVQVGQLVPVGQRNNVTAVTRKRVVKGELAKFAPQLAEICAWFMSAGSR